MTNIFKALRLPMVAWPPPPEQYWRHMVAGQPKAGNCSFVAQAWSSHFRILPLPRGSNFQGQRIGDLSPEARIYQQIGAEIVETV